jgi:hypothetical protein
VLDVDGDAGVDGVKRPQEPDPEVLVVAAADGDELPGGVGGPAVQRVAAADVDRVLAGRHALEAVIEDAVDAAVPLVDAGVLRGRVIHQAAQVLDRRDGIDALPEQVAGIHLGPYVGGVDLGGQPLHRARVEHDIVRVHLDGHLHPGVAGPRLDVGPERDHHLAPLVVQRVEELAVPGVDHPRRGPAARMRGRQPGHGDDAADPSRPASVIA